MLLILVIMMLSVSGRFAMSVMEGGINRVNYEDIVALVQKLGSETKKSQSAKTLITDNRAAAINLLKIIALLIDVGAAFFIGRISKDVIDATLMFWLMTGYTVFGLAFIGELIPTTLGITFKTEVTLATARTFGWLLARYSPMRLLKISDKLSKRRGQRYDETTIVATAVAAEEHGGLRLGGARLVGATVDLANQTLTALMVPLERCTIVPVILSRQQLVEAASRHSRVLVCEEQDLGTIIAVIASKDVLKMLEARPTEKTFDLSKRVKMRKILDLSANTPIPRALALLERDDEDIAIVSDRGKPIGAVFLDDILKIIVETEE